MGVFYLAMCIEGSLVTFLGSVPVFSWPVICLSVVLAIFYCHQKPVKRHLRGYFEDAMSMMGRHGAGVPEVVEVWSCPLTSQCIRKPRRKCWCAGACLSLSCSSGPRAGHAAVYIKVGGLLSTVSLLWKCSNSKSTMKISHCTNVSVSGTLVDYRLGNYKPSNFKCQHVGLSVDYHFQPMWVKCFCFIE